MFCAGFGIFYGLTLVRVDILGALGFDWTYLPSLGFFFRFSRVCSCESVSPLWDALCVSLARIGHFVVEVTNRSIGALFR